MERHAESLFKACEVAMSSSHPLANGGVRVATRTIEIPQRSLSRDQVRLAEWFLKQDPATVDLDEHTLKATGHRYSFYGNSVVVERWFARDTIGMWDWHVRCGLRPPSDRIEVQAIAVGDLAFVGFPAEMFTEFGLRIKDESPFRTTFVCGNANGYLGYIPTPEAFTHGGYETRFATHSRLIPEAGDIMTEVALDLLGE